jgi:hypothetical protein
MYEIYIDIFFYSIKIFAFYSKPILLARVQNYNFPQIGTHHKLSSSDTEPFWYYLFSFCQHGDSCVFAHSSSELRAKNNFGGNGNNMMMDGGGPFNMAKRKRDNTKTVLCQNYSTYGECQFGGNCNFAHGPEELALSKKQRF